MGPGLRPAGRNRDDTQVASADIPVADRHAGRGLGFQLRCRQFGQQGRVAEQGDQPLAVGAVGGVGAALELGGQGREPGADLRADGRRDLGLTRGARQIQHQPGLHPPRDLAQAAGGRGEGGVDQPVQHLARAELSRIAPVLVDQPGHAIGGQQVVEGQAGGDLGGDQRIEHRAAGGGENLDHVLAVGIARLGRGQHRRQGLRRIERLGIERGEQGGERGALLGGRDRRGGLAAVADHRVGEVDAAEQLAGRLQLIAVQQIDRHVLALEVGHRLAGLQRAEAELVESGAAHGHHAGQLGGRVGAVVPEAAPGLGDAQRPGVDVGDVALALVDRGLDLAQGGLAVLAIEPVDGELVPSADVHAVGVGEVDAAVLQQHPRGRIVHDAAAVLGRAGEVVRKADRVADLVGRELAQAGQRHLDRIVRAAGPVVVGADQALEDQHVLAHPQGAQQHRALDDLAGARIDHGLAGGPAAGGAVDPVDDVVADVQRVGALRQHLDLEGVNEARGLERLAPPGRALDQGAADRLGRGAVDIEDDRLPDRRAGGGRVGLLQPEAVGVALDDLLAERGGVVEHHGREAAGARVEGARLVAGLGQLHQAVADLEGDQLGVGSDVAHLRPRGVGGVGLAGLELKVLGENLHRARVGDGEVGN